MEKTWKIELSGFADEINPQLDEQIRVLKKLGMHYVEMRGANGKGLVEYPLDEVEKIKEQLDENDIHLSSVGSPIGKIPITQDFEEHFKLFCHTVNIAHVMEVPYIRMFSFFMPEGEDPEKYHDEVSAEWEEWLITQQSTTSFFFMRTRRKFMVMWQIAAES